MNEEKAVEYLDNLDKRAFMTMNEVDLTNLVIKYKKQIEQLQDDVDQAYSTASNYAKRFLKAIEYLKDNADYEQDTNQFCDDLNYDLCSELLNILTGEDIKKDLEGSEK